jgi:hypothetical protein
VTGGDAVLVGIMVLGPLLPQEPISFHIFSLLALQHEMNLAAWWSGAQLFLVALVMWERASCGYPRERGAWGVLAFVSAGLSFDEIGSIHERLGHRTWWPLLFVAIPLVAAVGWALFRLVRIPGRRMAVALIVSAYGLFGAVAGLEYLESVVGETGYYGLGLELEESLELLGFLCLLFAGIGRRPAGASGLGAVIPDPGRLAYLPALLTAGLVGYPVLAVGIVPRFTDLYVRGNPTVWYPSAVFALLACQAVATRRDADPAHRRAWGILAALFLAASIGAVFPLVNLTPNIHLVLPRWVYSGSYATYLLLVLPVLLLAPRVLRREGGRLVGVLVVLAVFLAVRVAKPDQRLDDVLAGLVAYLFAVVFMDPRLRTPAPTGALEAPRSAPVT